MGYIPIDQSNWAYSNMRKGYTKWPVWVRHQYLHPYEEPMVPELAAYTTQSVEKNVQLINAAIAQWYATSSMINA